MRIKTVSNVVNFCFVIPVMLEGGANNVNYDLMKQAINIGQQESMKVIKCIQDFIEKSSIFKHTASTTKNFGDALQQEIMTEVKK